MRSRRRAPRCTRGWRAAAPGPRTRPPRPWRSQTCRPRCAWPRRRRRSRCTRSRAPATSAARRSLGPCSRARAACLLGAPGLMPVCRLVSVSHEDAKTFSGKQSGHCLPPLALAPNKERRCTMQVLSCAGGGANHHRMWSTRLGRPVERLDWRRLQSARPSSRRTRPRTRPTRQSPARAGARPGRRACARMPAGLPAGSARRTAPPRPACTTRGRVEQSPLFALD